MDTEDRKVEIGLLERTKDATNKSKSHNEKAILLDKADKVSEKEAVKLRYAAIGISWLAAILSCILGITAIVFAALYGSQSLYSFGLDSVLDSVSSIVILWRFHGRDTIYSEKRELRACIMIGALFVLSGVLLTGRCVYALVSKELPQMPSEILILSSVNVVCCLVLGSGKVYLGRELESRALITDSIITFTGAVMSIFIPMFAAIYDFNKRLWYLDDSFGLLCSIFLVVYGIRVIVVSILDLKNRTEKESS